MIPNPIRKVLSSIQAQQVRALLMGGQACVFYGAAEFSRDTDLAILADARNLSRLRRALDELEAEVIAVPPFDLEYLRRGHAVHFRCRHPEARGMRIDVMARMRGVDAFPKLWIRRTTLTLRDGLSCHLLSLPDLVQAKKTQRDKDWPMLRRLVEANYFLNRSKRAPAQVEFWLRELRTPQLLVEAARNHSSACRRLRGQGRSWRSPVPETWRLSNASCSSKSSASARPTAPTGSRCGRSWKRCGTSDGGRGDSDSKRRLMRTAWLACRRENSQAGAGALRAGRVSLI